MPELMQFVEASFLQEGQRIKFKGKRAWWKVVGKEDGCKIVRRGQQTKRLIFGCTVLQKPSEEL